MLVQDIYRKFKLYENVSIIKKESSKILWCGYAGDIPLRLMDSEVIDIFSYVLGSSDSGIVITVRK